jgi:spore coat polysaccharide biosynthesis protein SpsF (cytidylyltransferase family)
MGSTRLPNKSMLDLCGAPLVGRILERLLRTNYISELVLAIPDTPDNEILADLAQEYGVTVFRGSENNLLDRYYQCALKLNADYIVRVPADNPLSEPEEIDKVIQHHIAFNHHGFTSNLAEVFDSGYPDGIGAEVFSMQSLSEVWLAETDSRKLEHVHLNFFDYETQTATNPAKYPVSTIICPSEYARPDIILDINEWSEYRNIRNIYKSLYLKNSKFGIKEIIDLLTGLSTTETDHND